MTLLEQFQVDFKDAEFVTTKEIYAWYTSAKKGSSPYTYRTSLYTLIINPLLIKGVITKSAKGLYRFTNVVAQQIESQDHQQEMDEWDLYIKGKMEDAHAHEK